MQNDLFWICALRKVIGIVVIQFLSKNCVFMNNLEVFIWKIEIDFLAMKSTVFLENGVLQLKINKQ